MDASSWFLVDIFFDLPYTEENSGIVQKVKVIPFETSFRTLDF